MKFAADFMREITHRTSRRQFLRNTAGAVTAAAVLPNSMIGLRGARSPNEKLNIACIGVGGRGAVNVRAVQDENIVALCDVDEERGARSFEQFPKAKRFTDFRRMLDDMEREIDAVVVSTPDHTHAAALLDAMERGKHVYSEKPLAHSVYEIRRILDTARRQRVATQLGNQGHSFDSIRVFREWIEDGVIGPVREVQTMCGSNYSRIAQLQEVQEPMPVPGHLDWDLWLGPAQFRPYHPAYLPGSWRGWSPFGTGVIGDWTCHVIDPVFWALDLGAPETVIAEPSHDYKPKEHSDTFPPASIVRYQFPARGNRPAVRISWYDGVLRPERPEDMDEGDEMPRIGAIVIGDKGKILYGSHGASRLRVIAGGPEEKPSREPQRLEKSPGHHQEWIHACKGGPAAGSRFEYGGPLTEVALLGIIAMRFPGQVLKWDAEQARITNFEEANACIRPEYRDGWNL